MQCILLLVATTMVTSNLIVDFLYGFLDPRLRAKRSALHDRRDAEGHRPSAAASACRAIPVSVALAVSLDRRHAGDRGASPRTSRPTASPSSTCATGSPPRPAMSRIWLGTDELGRDVLSRLLVSIRISLLIAFGATAISALLGTTLGFLAAHFRGAVEQLVLMLVDFQASMPFLIMALAVLAFFGNSLPLLIGLMGLYGWERYARIARGLAISANAQGYAAAVRQLGADAVADLSAAHPAQHRLDPDRLDDAGLSRGHPDGMRPVLPRPRRAAADDQPRQHGRLRPRVPDPARPGSCWPRRPSSC